MGKTGLVVLSLLYFQQNPAQDRQYLFTNIDISGGLSHNHVQCFLKDSKGFLWTGTYEGLNRFDGYSFKVFRNIQGDSTSLKDNMITGLFEDPWGKIWIGAGSFLEIYDPEKEIFFHGESLLDGRIPVPVNSTWNAAYDARGDLIYANSVSGIHKYYVNTDSVVKIASVSPRNDSTISWMALDRDGNIWVSYTYSLLYKIDGQNHDFTDSIELPLMQDHTYRFFIDDDNDFWIYCISHAIGILFYDSGSRTLQNFTTTSSRGRLSNNNLGGIIQDSDGKIWISTDHGGVNIVSKDDFSVNYLLNDPLNSRSLPDNTTTCMYRDNQDFIWLGSFKNGLSYYHKDLFLFDYHKVVLSDRKTPGYNDIDNFAEDRHGNIWIGTNGGGLIYYDRRKNTYRQYVHDPADPSSISANIIIGLYYDKKDRLWIGTYFGGLNLWDGKGFQHFRNNPADPNSLSDNRVWDICEDNNGMLWIATLLGGVNVLDPETKKFIACYRNTQDMTIRSSVVFSVIQGSNNLMWFATVDGIRSFDLTTGKFAYYSHDDHDPGSLSKNYVLDVYEDSRGFIWAATTDGLNRLNKNTGKWDIFRTAQGLPDNRIIALMEDRYHNLWMSTSNGLSRLTVSTGNDSARYSFRNFTEFDGLQANEFNEKAIMRARSGELFFGGPNGFNIIDPAHTDPRNINSSIVFTNFLLFNKSVDIKKAQHNRFTLENAMPYTQDIRLKHNENMFTIEFSDLNFMHPERRNYMYRLDNFKDEWFIVDSRERKITYTNLNPGKYVFRVRSTNNDGSWNDKEARLSIVISPPWWNRWLVRITGILLLISSVFAFYNYRLRFLHRQKKMLETKVQDRTDAIYKANLQLEENQREVMLQNIELEKHRNHLEQLILNRTTELEEALRKARESDRLKSAFLANMSHEIRTPMNAIVGFSSLLDDKDITKKEKKEFIGLIHSNSESLLNLINDILDLSLIEANQLFVRSEPFSLNEVFEQIVSYFRMRNRDSGIEFRISHALKEEDLALVSDKFRLKQILTNFLSNAFKYTQEGTIEFGSERDGNMLAFYVKDTGVGISEENIPYLFERFRKAGSDSSESTRGAGLGLAISQKLADLLGGRIDVQSETGKGSQFTFRIPLDRVTTQAVFKKASVKKRKDRNWSDKRILIVEDETANYLYLQRSIEKTFADITWAKNGMEAVMYVESGKYFDLVLMDIKMAVMDGTKAMKRMKAINPRLTVIAQTAFARAEDEVTLRHQGFDDYLSKPIDRKDLLGVLDKYL